MHDHSDSLTIWIVDPINYSGMAYYDAGLAAGLAEAGADVTLAGSDRPLVPLSRPSRWRLESIFRRTGTERSRWQRAIAYGLSMARLMRRLYRARPDVLIWNYVEVPLLDVIAIRAARWMGARVAFIAHETTPWGQSRSRHWAYRSIIEHQAAMVIVHGQSGANSLHEDWEIPPERVFVSEHGDYRDWVDPTADRSAARDRLGLPLNAPLALFFGTLRMSKGVAALLQAWPSVLAEVPDARLVIAGRAYRGTDPSAFDEADEGIVLRIGGTTPSEANDYYAACDVVAIPYDKVSTSGVMRYAYSAARTVVATDAGELSNHVIEGKTGWLVPPGDRGALASALAACLSDRATATEMGRAAHAYAESEFSWTTIGQRLYAALRNLSVKPD